MATRIPRIYTIGLMFWRDVPKADINAAIKQRVTLMKSLRLGGKDMIWQANGNADAKPTLGNLSCMMFFKTKAAWEKAAKKMAKDKRFEYHPLNNQEVHQGYRGYRYIQPEKTR